MKIIGQIRSLVTSASEMVISGTSRFAFEVYPQLPGGNAVMAPLSLSTALAMAFLGTRGQTTAEMGRPLFLTDPWARQLGKHALKLSFQNSLWHHPQHPFQPTYLAALEESFKASARPLENPDGSERNAVNAWVETATQKRIPVLFNSGALNDSTRLVLVSSVTFSSPWECPFQLKPVTSPSGRVEQDPFMHLKGNLGFLGNELFQLLEVPCQGNALSVCFMLPRERAGLSRITQGLDAKKFAGWVKEIKVAPVEVSLPRFQVGSKLDLADALTSMGLSRAFTAGQADFSAMSASPELSMSRVLNQTAVEVTEAGVQASAVTAVVFAPRPYLTERVVSNQPDHPFQFFVRDRQSNAILAMGRGERPQG